MLKKGRGAHVLMEVRSRGGSVRRLKKGRGERDLLFRNKFSNMYKFCKSNIQKNANRYETGNIKKQANGSSRKKGGVGR